MRGFWADEKVDNGQWDLNKPLFKKIYNHYKEKEKAFLLNADGIVSLTEASKNYLLSQPGYEHLSIQVIPCCADLQHFDYHNIDGSRSEALKNELGIPANAKLVSYLGSVGGWYMTKEMFLFFKLLLEKDQVYHMLILTKDNPQQVKNEAAIYGIPESKLTVTYVERKSMPLYLSLSIFSIFFIRNTFSKIASSPTKHAELMGMGIPVVCNNIGDTGYIIEKTGTGLLVNSFDEESIKHALSKLELLQQIPPEAIRACATLYYDLESGAKKYASIYANILKTHQAKVSFHA